MLTERTTCGVLIRTEAVIMLGTVRVTQKQIIDGKTDKMNTVYLDKTEMDELIRSYNSEEVKTYFENYPKSTQKE